MSDTLLCFHARAISQRPGSAFLYITSWTSAGTLPCTFLSKKTVVYHVESGVVWHACSASRSHVARGVEKENGDWNLIRLIRYLPAARCWQGILILARTRLRLVTWAMDAPCLPLARSKKERTAVGEAHFSYMYYLVTNRRFMNSWA